MAPRSRSEESQYELSEEELRSVERTERLMIGFYSVVMGLCILAALVLLYAGFATNNALTQIDCFAAAAVIAIIARIAQAAKHHTENQRDR